MPKIKNIWLYNYSLNVWHPLIWPVFLFFVVVVCVFGVPLVSAQSKKNHSKKLIHWFYCYASVFAIQSKKEYAGSKFARWKMFPFHQISFYVRKQKEKIWKLRGCIQPLRAKVNSPPVVVSAVIGRDAPLCFECGAPHSSIPSL